MQPFRRPIRIMSDFGGMCMHLMSMDVLGIDYNHRRYSEKLPELQSFVRANYPASVVDDDATDRQVEGMEEVDMVVCTFPCQPFSNAGKRQVGSLHY